MSGKSFHFGVNFPFKVARERGFGVNFPFKVAREREALAGKRRLQLA